MGKIDEIKETAADACYLAKYRIDDFTQQLKTRVTKDYVDILGRQIKISCLETVSRPAMLNN